MSNTSPAKGGVKNKKIILVILVAVLCCCVATYSLYELLTPQRTTIYTFNGDYSAGTLVTNDMLTPVEIDQTLIVNSNQMSAGDYFVTSANYQNVITSAGILRSDVHSGNALMSSMLTTTGGNSIEMSMKQNAVAITIGANYIIDEDLRLRKAVQRTKVVTVYSAKGGVGKTSIATELAVCLALTSNGRRRFRVCIVDYNIDFGDVATTLELRDDGPNMSYWASEIRGMLENDKEPDDIQFTREDMESHYLQKMKDTGLYALCAPITHEDSMLVKPTELEIMLRNIIDHGEFDFVICDTGNNTRDSSIIALDHSEYVLLVATQDVTTANCNASVLRTLQDAGFDTDKVRLVVNSVLSSRETGISVQEVEETFPYKCVARIKRTNDIIKANNLSRPLVYKPNHDYTKQIQRIVRYITEGERMEEPQKKKLFSFGKR